MEIERQPFVRVESTSRAKARAFFGEPVDAPAREEPNTSRLVVGGVVNVFSVWIDQETPPPEGSGWRRD